MNKQQRDNDRNASVANEQHILSDRPKQNYSPPRLTAYGSLVDLTKATAGNIADGFVGSGNA